MTVLSPLQKFLLKECLDSTVTRRSALKKFYSKQAKVPRTEDQQNAITKSLERLIDRGYMVGYGRRTPEKWFIESVRLTAAGKRAGKSLLGKQQQIPFTRH